MTASVAGVGSDTEDFTITDTAVAIPAPNTQANSISGYRVEIVPPTEDWLGIEDSVKVRVFRRQGPSFPWGSFTSITVGLFDEGVGHDNDGDRSVPLRHSIAG